ncbi:putative uncharacterized protein [Clostridium sp. CAG:921]|nr:putative uncharacterized protein [Clostridium sp. CAG:921]
MKKGKFVVNINGNTKRRSAIIKKTQTTEKTNSDNDLLNNGKVTDNKNSSINVSDNSGEILSQENESIIKKRSGYAYADSKDDSKEELLKELDEIVEENKSSVKRRAKLNVDIDDEKISSDISILTDALDDKNKDKVNYELEKEQVKNEKIENKNIYDDELNLGRRTIRSAKDNKPIDDSLNILKMHNQKEKADREKRIGKTLNEVRDEINKIKNEKIKAFIVAKRFIFMIILLVVLCTLVLLYEYGPIFGISLDKFDTGKEKKIDIVTGENDIYMNYNEELLVYSNQKVATYNKNAKKTWEYNLDSMFTPSIYTYEKYMVIVNNTSGNIYLFESKKEILDQKIDGTINHVYLDEYGNMAVEYSTSGYKKVVGVYNKSGRNLYNAYLDNDAIVDLKIIENSNKLLVLQTSSVSSKIGIKVNLIDGTKENDNLIQIAKFDNNFVYDLTIQGRNIIIVLDDRLVKLNIDDKKVTDIMSFESSQLSFISLTSNYFTTVEKELNSDSSNYKINMKRFDNSLISSTSIDNVPKFIQNSGLLNYFVYQDRLSVINKWGIEVKSENIDIAPKNIIVFNGQKAIALVYTNKIRVIKI